MKELLIIILFFVSINTYGQEEQKNTNQKEIDKIICQLSNKYHIKFIYDSIPLASWKEVDYDIIKYNNDKEFNNYLQIFSIEFNKYPVSFIKKSGIKYIAFVKFLNYNGQYRAALPDAHKEILFYDITKGRNKSIYKCSRTKYYLRHTIHHEIYHMLEEQINGNMYYKDSVWIKLNYEGFEYGKGGTSFYFEKKEKTNKINIYLNKPYKITNPTKGFSSTYALSALEEDKCEIYSSLFIARESRKIKRLCKKDEILRNKITYIKKFLESICSEMDENYWKNLN